MPSASPVVHLDFYSYIDTDIEAAQVPALNEEQRSADDSFKEIPFLKSSPQEIKRKKI